jgi:hypothetical protein
MIYKLETCVMKHWNVRSYHMESEIGVPDAETKYLQQRRGQLPT